MRPAYLHHLVLATSLSFLTLTFVACCCPPIPVGNNRPAPPQVVADRGRPDVVEEANKPPAPAPTKPVTPTRVPQEQAKARAKEYRDWLDKIVAMQKRLEAARAQGLLRDDAKWGEFARQFAKDHKAYSDEIGKLESLPARLIIVSALGDLHAMFLATARSDAPRYKEASEIYAESLTKLQGFVKEAESK